MMAAARPRGGCEEARAENQDCNQHLTPRDTQQAAMTALRRYIHRHRTGIL
jgi:superfamily II DNA or RNA helicase